MYIVDTINFSVNYERRFAFKRNDHTCIQKILGASKPNQHKETQRLPSNIYRDFDEMKEVCCIECNCVLSSFSVLQYIKMQTFFYSDITT